MQHKEKEQNLISNLKKYQKVLIAFSGGVDSTYLAEIAYKALGNNAIAVTIQPEYVSSREIEEAKELASLIGITHKIVILNTLENENIANNPPDRCFYCKTDLFSQLINVAEELGIQYVLDGSNLDDLKDYRPGLRALNNLGIISPLKDAKLTKNDIRLLSRELNLPTWDKPAFSCLATRIPYGTTLTEFNLRQVEKAEDFLIKLGIKQFRVRHHGDIARIEVIPDEFNKIIAFNNEIIVEFKDLGFNYTTLDLQGYRSGSLNELFKKAE